MADNAFRRFLEAGYTRLVPITPPLCEVSEHSSLYKRRGALGKAPGVRGPDGFWRGVDWLKIQPTDADYDKWAADGAGVGIRTGAGLIAIDIDVLDKGLADTCGTTATQILGASENRVGRAPKRLKMYRVDEPVAYRKLSFDGGAVELLSEGKQFVAHGLHPVTGKNYEWPRGLPHYDKLPIVTAQQISTYFEKLAELLPAAKVDVDSSPAERANVDQEGLRGSLDDIRRAVACLPNTSAIAPSYDDYVRVGYAIKGATQDDPEAGLELFQEWSAKWADGHNDPDFVAATWRRMKPPYSVGASYLYHLAQQHGGFSTAEAWFQASSQEIELNPFEGRTDQQSKLEPIAWLDPADTWTGEPPAREWEVKDWIPRGEVSLLYGEGGVGKTLLALQYAVCAAAGLPWLGQETRASKVMCFLCEDDNSELWRRYYAICKALAVDPASLRGRLRIVSRTGEDNILAGWSQRDMRMHRTTLWAQLRADVETFGADVAVVDTLVDVFAGSEIDRSQANAFIKSCLKPLAPTVLALAHPSVGGRQEGRSGSTGWSNAARSRMYLRRPKGVEAGDARELEAMKTNYAGVGSRIQLKWARGAFLAQAASKPGVDVDELRGAVLPTIEDVTQRAVLEALARAENDNLPLNLNARSTAYAPRVLKRAYGVDGRSDEVEAALLALEARGLVRVATWRDTSRNLVTGYKVKPVSEGVFA